MNPDASDEMYGLAYNVRLAKRADPSKQVSHSSFHDFWTKAKLKDNPIHLVHH